MTTSTTNTQSFTQEQVMELVGATGYWYIDSKGSLYSMTMGRHDILLEANDLSLVHPALYAAIQATISYKQKFDPNIRGIDGSSGIDNLNVLNNHFLLLKDSFGNDCLLSKVNRLKVSDNPRMPVEVQARQYVVKHTGGGSEPTPYVIEHVMKVFLVTHAELERSFPGWYMRFETADSLALKNEDLINFVLKLDSPKCGPVAVPDADYAASCTSI